MGVPETLVFFSHQLFFTAAIGRVQLFLDGGTYRTSISKITYIYMYLLVIFQGGGGGRGSGPLSPL